MLDMEKEVNEVRELIAALRTKGWTVAAIADHLKVDRDSVYRWERGLRSPANAVGVVLALRRLLQRRRIPKRSRRGSKRNPPAT
jgi:transcriptional regulator with XRE-family HTH domain